MNVDLDKVYKIITFNPLNAGLASPNKEPTSKMAFEAKLFADLVFKDGFPRMDDQFRMLYRCHNKDENIPLMLFAVVYNGTSESDIKLATMTLNSFFEHKTDTIMVKYARAVSSFPPLVVADYEEYVDAYDRQAYILKSIDNDLIHIANNEDRKKYHDSVFNCDTRKSRTPTPNVQMPGPNSQATSPTTGTTFGRNEGRKRKAVPVGAVGSSKDMSPKKIGAKTPKGRKKNDRTKKAKKLKKITITKIGDNSSPKMMVQALLDSVKQSQTTTEKVLAAVKDLAVKVEEDKEERVKLSDRLADLEEKMGHVLCHDASLVSHLVQKYLPVDSEAEAHHLFATRMDLCNLLRHHVIVNIPIDYESWSFSVVGLIFTEAYRASHFYPLNLGESEFSSRPCGPSQERLKRVEPAFWTWYDEVSSLSIAQHDRYQKISFRQQTRKLFGTNVKDKTTTKRAVKSVLDLGLSDLP